MMRYVVLALLVALTGCGQERQNRFSELKAQCDAAIPTEVGRYAEKARCLNQAGIEAGFHGPAEDYLSATRLNLGEQVDAGKISPSEANAKLAELRYRLNENARADAIATLSAMPQPHSTTCTRIGTMTQCNGY